MGKFAHVADFKRENGKSWYREKDLKMLTDGKLKSLRPLANA